MITRKLILLIYTLILSLFLSGCGASAEYTSAKRAIDKKNWAEAEEYLFKALEVEPDNAAVMFHIGRYVHARNSEWAEMNKMFDEAIKIDPNAKVDNRSVKESANYYKSLVWAENYNKAIQYYNEYRESRNKSTLESAINLFQATLIIDPEQNQTYSTLATAYFESGDKVKSVEYAKKAYEMTPNDFNTNYTFGQILSLTGDKESAIIYIEKANSLEPTDLGVLKQLAGLYYETDKKEQSVETFQMAIKQESEKTAKADLYYNLGVLYMELNNFEEADIAFEEAYYNNDKDFEAIVGMATIYESQADKYFNGKEEDFPKDYYKAEKLYKKAKTKYKDLYNLDPDNESKYKKQVSLIDYKLNIAIENQN